MDKDAFRLLRKQYKLTQEEIGKRLPPGYSRFAVNAWETGKANLPPDIMQKLAAANLLAPAQKEPTKAEQARKAAEDKLIEYDVRSYRMLRVWPEYSNHNKAMKLFASQGHTFHPKALPLILAEFPDILTDPDGHYPVDKDTAQLTLGLTDSESPTPKG